MLEYKVNGKQLVELSLENNGVGLFQFLVKGKGFQFYEKRGMVLNVTLSTT